MLAAIILAMALPLSAIAKTTTTTSEFETYLNQNFASIETSVGTFTMKHEVVETAIPSIVSPHEIWIQTEWNPAEISPYEIQYGTKYTTEQKREIVQAWQSIQEMVYAAANENLSGKRVLGGFYYSYYKYPNLKVGLESTRFLTWKNHTVDIDWLQPENAVITDDVFNWDFFIDDYDFTDYMKSKEREPK